MRKQSAAQIPSCENCERRVLAFTYENFLAFTHACEAHTQSTPEGRIERTANQVTTQRRPALLFRSTR
jgi:hypothetical protein